MGNINNMNNFSTISKTKQITELSKFKNLSYPVIMRIVENDIVAAKRSFALDFIKTSGGCMRPLIKNGDVVRIVKKNRYCLGDVVLYEINGQKFLHRIIKILSNKKYVVCDDTGITEPVEINFDNIIGFYPNIFNGVLGYVYYIVIKTIFCIARKIKILLKRLWWFTSKCREKEA